MQCPRCQYPFVNEKLGCSSCGWKNEENPVPVDDLAERVTREFEREFPKAPPEKKK